MWTTHFAETAVQPSAEWLGSRPGRDVSGAQILNAIRKISCCGACISIKELTGLEHRMHYHRQFARHSHGSSFEANPLPELDAPRAQAAVELRVRMTAAAS